MWWDLASTGDRWEGADTGEFTWTVLESDREDQIKIRCIITDASGNSVTSDEVLILKKSESSTVTRPGIETGSRPTRSLTITTQPKYVEAPVGSQVVYSVSASGGNSFCCP